MRTISVADDILQWMDFDIEEDLAEDAAMECGMTPLTGNDPRNTPTPCPDCAALFNLLGEAFANSVGLLSRGPSGAGDLMLHPHGCAGSVPLTLEVLTGLLCDTDKDKRIEELESRLFKAEKGTNRRRNESDEDDDIDS